MSMVVEISMPYIGSCLSVNHYKYKNRFTKPETRAWMDCLQLEWLWRDTKYNFKVKMPPTIHLSGIFKDKRSCCDLNNLHKVIADALESALHINDREFRFVDEGYTIDKSKDPTLVIGVVVEDAI